VNNKRDVKVYMVTITHNSSMDRTFQICEAYMAKVFDKIVRLRLLWDKKAGEELVLVAAK